MRCIFLDGYQYKHKLSIYSMVHDTKLYDILEIKPEATETDIKKSYKKLSFKWHPDKNPDNVEEATKKFQEVSEAYAILIDGEKRAQYDRDGYDSLKNPQGGFNPNDIFEQFFGNFGGHSDFFNRGQQPQQMEHCVVEKEVSLEELFCMKTVKISYKQKTFCKKCNGNGTKDGSASKCSGCNGAGKVMKVIQRGNMIQQAVMHCSECNGSGEKVVKNNICGDCNGKKVLTNDKSIDIPLTKNLTNGAKMVLNGKGHVFKNNTSNLIVVIKEKPHALFKRNGNDLHMTMKLRLFQTLFGFTKAIHHLDGRQLIIRYKNIKKMETMLLVKNEGMGGDLYIHISTNIPNLEKLEENERTILKKLLVKTNQTEFNKENALNKDPDLVNINITEIDIPDDIDENEHPFEQQGGSIPPGSIPPGVQCAQQ